MALRAFYFIRTLAYYYIKCSPRHLLATFENSWLEGPIEFQYRIDVIAPTVNVLMYQGYYAWFVKQSTIVP